MSESSLVLSDRVNAIQPSPTLALSARAAELKAAGQDIINLSVGEPDFDTPNHIKEAAAQAMADGLTKYTPVDGIPTLKQAICKKFANDNQLDYQPNQILVSCGGKQSFFNLCQALLNPGDEVIIPAPYWVSYPDIVKLAGGIPTIVNATVDSHYKITAEQLAESINANTKLFVINSPSNPSGIAYSKAELAALAEVLLEHPQVLVATDDMYEHILWSDEPFSNIVSACPDLYPRSIVLNGVSKAYAMTGWRIGYAGGPQPLITAMKKIQSQSTSNPCSIAQAAAEAALSGSQQCVATMRDAFKNRHDYVYERLNAIDGVKALPSDGTFYTFPDCSEIIASNPDWQADLDFVDYLINGAGLTPVPGSAFGAPGCLRMSFATSEALLEDALNRFEEAIQQIK